MVVDGPMQEWLAQFLVFVAVGLGLSPCVLIRHADDMARRLARSVYRSTAPAPPR